MNEPKHHRIEIGGDRIAVLTLDMQGKNANVLSTESVGELTDSIRWLGAMGTRQVKGLLVRSGKPKQFIAGANIEEIRALTNPAIAAEKARNGQALMNAIETLPFPSVSVIDGPCLGGGLEFALACTYRVAGEDSHVRLALPEVKLGIIPGFGGTQRLPRIVGLYAAIDLITTGKMLDAKRAYRIGLVDDYTSSAILEEVARKWIGKGFRPRKPTRLPHWQKWIECFPIAWQFMLRLARKKAVEATSGFYPAPLAAIDVLNETFHARSVDGYEVEAKHVGDLIASPVSKALISIFLATEEIRRMKWNAPPRPVQQTAVIGAGVMGAGIAQLLTTRGKGVRLRDLSNDFLAKGIRTIRELNQKDLRRKRISVQEHDARMSRLSTTTEWTGLGRVDFVIEAALEEIQVKKDVFAELSKRVRPETILATNTSALSITEIASAVSHPERVIGLHFFNPVHRMPLIEIVKGTNTSNETIATAFDLAIALGKTPIVVADRPGFLVNRILGFYLNEASLMAEEGIPFPEIDRILKNFGMPMGPFELMDEVGLDIAEKVGIYLSEALPGYPKRSGLLSKVRKDGRIGKKGGKGFYIHGKGKPKPVGDLGPLSSATPLDPNTITDRLILVMVNEACRCLAEGVVSSKRDVDIGMVLGTGFAPFRGGLMAYASSRGKSEIIATLSRLAEKYGPQFLPGDPISQIDF